MPRVTCEWPRPVKLSHECGKCHKVKPFTRDHFGPDKRSRYGLAMGWCRACITHYSKNRNKETRANVLIHYSGGSPACACCGDDRFEFLTLDHVHGGGNAHRLEVTGNKRGQVNSWIVKNGYPPGFQVLCYNCNMGRAANGGTCPYAKSHAYVPHTNRRSA